MPSALRVETLKLLALIRLAANPDDLWRTSDRASGFILGLETVETLDAAGIKWLYEVFDEAAKPRRQDESL